ncbi:MAG: PAS domain S-box-containing protein [Bacteroidia bacterium]|jgi:PAS domain S-box-containing protein
MTPLRSTLIIDARIEQICSIFDSMQTPVLVVNLDLVPMYENHASFEYFGRKIVLIEETTDTLPELVNKTRSFATQDLLVEKHTLLNVDVEWRRFTVAGNELITISINDIEHKHNIPLLSTGHKVQDEVGLFYTLVQHAPDAILILDFDRKRYVEANKMAVELFGYEKEDLLKMILGDLSPVVLSSGQLSKEVYAKHITECIKKNLSVSFEWEIKSKSGTLIPCEIRVVKLPTSRGIYIRNSITDISERKRSELEIAAHKKHFSNVFENNITPLVIIDENQLILESNKAFCKLLGFKKPFLRKKRFESFIKGNSNVIKRELVHITSGGKRSQALPIKAQILGHNNQVFQTHISIKNVSEKGEVPNYLISIKDVSKEMQMVEKLNVQEHQYQSLFNHSPLGLMIYNVFENKIISINKKGLQILGYSLKELGGLDYKKTFFFNKPFINFEDNEQQIFAFIKQVLDNKVPTEKFRAIHKKGHDIFIEATGYRIYKQAKGFIVLGFSDITDLVQGHEKLIRKNNQLNAFVQDNTIPLAMLDRDMNFILVSKKWMNLFPSQKFTNIIGKNYQEVYSNTSMRWKLVHTRALKGETIQFNKDLFVGEDGNSKWLRWQVSPWYEREEEIGGLIINCEDISDEIQIEDKLKQTEGRFKSYFETTTIGWIELDVTKLLDQLQHLDADYSPVNFLDLYQKLATETVYNQQVMDIFGLQSLHSNMAEFQEFIQEGKERFVLKLYNSFKHNIGYFEEEVQIVNRFGETRYLYISAEIPTLNSGSHVVFGFLDITDLKTSVHALRESEERYRTIFDSNALGIIYTNYDKGIVKVNEAFESMFGYNESEMQGLKETEILYPAYVKLNDKMFENFRLAKIRNATLEQEYKQKNGRRLIAKTTSNALYDDGRHYGTVTMIEDITDRKIQESKIKHQNIELKKINRELDQFVYSAAHDLRAPIANVMGLVKLLRLEQLSGNALQYIDLQEKSLAKLDEFIRSIVDYSRNSRLKISKDSIEFNSFIHEIIDQYLYTENADKLKIRVVVDQSAKFISDKSRMSIVFNNLISNAVRYMDVSKKSPFLTVTIKANSKAAELVVEDNGIGIEEEHIDNIFKLFYRANSGSKGTGIGLYIVKDAIDKLKGRIEVRSGYTKGTTFVVHLKNLQ